jgi:hypothetical protein
MTARRAALWRLTLDLSKAVAQNARVCDAGASARLDRAEHQSQVHQSPE